MNRACILLLICLVATLATACSKPPPAPMGFQNRAQFEEYVDSITMPDAWKEAVKSETQQVSGKYINNMARYLKLQGEPVMALCKKYGMKAEIGFEGVDPTPAIQQAVRDLITAGDKQNIYKNDRWKDTEELNGVWEEGRNSFQQAAEFARQNRGDRKSSVASQPDFGDVKDR
ncbi:MAG: hypothetical protein HY814_03200 [Candidatus Riflebacteria bacterium]|nr:hypothetical protein [Candidatus Riflebacteria bacterium]